MNIYDSYDDSALVQLLQQGKEAAFTEIYHRYWKILYGLAYDRLKSRQMAEDIIQEVFAGLWQRREKTIIQSLNAYLSAATRYAIINQLARQVTISTNDLPFEIESVEDNAVQIRFLEQMIHKEVNRLPDKCRIVFQYSRTYGLSNKEIAAELNISEKAVEKHITKALRYLRVQLKQIFSLFM
jgi:RNA polymerase sigma-70 factor (ECF subfamily)